MKTVLSRSALPLLLLVLLPASAALAQESSTRPWSQDGRYRMMWSDDDYHFEVRAEGEIEFSKDYTAIDRLSRDGYLEVAEETGRFSRRVKITPSSDGTVTYQYYERDRRADLDADAEAWLADVILKVVRETAIDAERRVGMILREDGTDGVFAEVAAIRSSSSRSTYLLELVKQGDLGTNGLVRVARYAKDDISSSGSKARLLVATAPYYAAEPRARASYFDAAQSISSSGERSRVLINYLEHHRPDREAAVEILNAARGISSNGNKARVLIAASAYYDNSPELRAAFFDVANAINSSGERSRVLTTLLQRTRLDRDSANALFASVGTISSSGERSRVLTGASSYFANDQSTRDAYFAAVSGISSSGEKARVLTGILKEHELDPASMRALLGTTRGISSSGEKARVLVEAVPSYSNAVAEAYFDVAVSIQSSSETARALIALLQRNDLDENSMRGLLHTARKISSDGERTRVLVEAAPYVADNDALVEAYLETAGTISSSSSHSRALAALIDQR